MIIFSYPPKFSPDQSGLFRLIEFAYYSRTPRVLAPRRDLSHNGHSVFAPAWLSARFDADRTHLQLLGSSEQLQVQCMTLYVSNIIG